VSHREQEIGLRAALGATPHQIIGAMLRDGMRLAAGGLVAGILLALVAARLVSSFLYGVTPADPLTFVGVSLLLLATMLAASWIPARRAAKVDPVVALRKE
jgi:ABC-type antimicrobial peptide transport system permease subunit